MLHQWRLPVLAVTALFLAACASEQVDNGPAGADAGKSTTPSSATSEPPTPPTEAPPIALDFEPSTQIDYPAQPDGIPWPTDGWDKAELPDGADETLIDATLDEAFGELSTGQNHNFDAALVVHNGRIVVERYRDGFGDEATVHRSWSMAKSVTATLLGIVAGKGRIDIFEPAPVPEWGDPEDPRSAITTADLLHMASGLAFNEDYFAPDSDTIAMFTADDMASYAASKDLEAEPGTRVRYSTGTSNIVGRIVGDLVAGKDSSGTERAEGVSRFMREELLDPLGIEEDEIAPDFDEAGNLNAGSKIDATARAFAKLGYLYLRGGEWDGTQILSGSWVDFSRTPLPAPAGMENYGAHWWVDSDEPYRFRMGGFGGQHVVVVPSLDLVVVVLSDRLDAQDGRIRDQLITAFSGVAGDTGGG